MKPSEHLNYLLLSFNLLFYIMKLISVLLAPPTTTPSCPHLLVSARHTRTILVGLSSLSLSHLVTLSRLINKPTETTTIPIYIYIYIWTQLNWFLPLDQSIYLTTLRLVTYLSSLLVNSNMHPYEFISFSPYGRRKPHPHYHVF